MNLYNHEGAGAIMCVIVGMIIVLLLFSALIVYHMFRFG